MSEYKPKNSVVKFSMSIPEEIRPLVMERHILSTEDPKAYDDLFDMLLAYYQPKNTLQWFDVKRLLDTIVEESRYSRIKIGLIEIARKPALVALISSVSIAPRAADKAKAWFIDPDVREEIDDLLRKFNMSPEAKAFALCAAELQELGKMQVLNDARHYQVRRQLDEQSQLHSINPPLLDEKGSEKESE
jgi:hypothetical protein